MKQYVQGCISIVSNKQILRWLLSRPCFFGIFFFPGSGFFREECRHRHSLGLMRILSPCRRISCSSMDGLFHRVCHRRSYKIKRERFCITCKYSIKPIKGGGGRFTVYFRYYKWRVATQTSVLFQTHAIYFLPSMLEQRYIIIHCLQLG